MTGSEFHIALPTNKSSFPIKTTSQLRPWLDNLALQHCIVNDILTILGPYSSEPDSLCRTLVLAHGGLACISSPVDHDVRSVLVAADMADEVDAHATGSLIVQVTVQAQGPKVSLELAQKEGGRLAATSIARLLGAEENHGFMGASTGWECRSRRDR